MECLTTFWLDFRTCLGLWSRSKAHAWEVVDPRVEPAVLILLKGHAIKLPSNYAYTHRPGLLSAVVRGAFFQHEQEPRARCELVSMQRLSPAALAWNPSDPVGGHGDSRTPANSNPVWATEWGQGQPGQCSGSLTLNKEIPRGWSIAQR